MWIRNQRLDQRRNLETANAAFHHWKSVSNTHLLYPYNRRTMSWAVYLVVFFDVVVIMGHVFYPLFLMSLFYDYTSDRNSSIATSAADLLHYR